MPERTPRLRARVRSLRGGRAVAAVLPLLVWLAAIAALMLVPRPATAQEEEPEQVLPGSGIRYPGGYDPHTVGTVSGTVEALAEPERGPVRFRLAAEGGSYLVLACPAWFWKASGFTLGDGDLVSVSGSKALGADGELYLVAGEISRQPEGSRIVLRDECGVPLWSRRGRTGMGKGGGRCGPMHRRGGRSAPR